MSLCSRRLLWGFMVNWIAGQWPDRFKCLVTYDGIFDNRTMYSTTEELWVPEWEMAPGVPGSGRLMLSSTPPTTSRSGRRRPW